MASLLDAYIARNPQLGGLLGQAGGQGTQGPAPAPGVPAPQLQQGLLPGAGGAPQAPAPPQPQPQQQAAQAQAQQQRQMQLREIVQQAGRAVSPPPGDSRPRIDKRETLLNTGLALLAGGRDVTMGQAIATGVMAGRQAAAASDLLRQQEIQAQQRAQQYMSVFGGGPMTREKIDQAIQVATINNDTETLKVMKDIRGQMPDEEQESWTPKEISGTLVFTNDEGRVHDADGNRLTASDLELMEGEEAESFSPKVIAGQLYFTKDGEPGVYDADGNQISAADIPSGQEPVRPIFRTTVDEAGNKIEVAVNPFTLQPIPGSEMIQERASSESSAFGEILTHELNNVREIIGDDPSTPEVEGADQFRALTGKFGALAQRLPDRMKSADVQRLNSAVGNIVSLVIRDRSGTQASDAEVERLLEVVAPKAGDTAATVRAKLERIEWMVQTTQTEGANAATDPFMGVGDVIQEFDALGGGG